MQRHQVEFKGQAGEYFGIWIVNVLLSIVTLGIYGAWAKVRDKKYMYGNTFIADHSFDYHATGKQIFIGRVIVAAVLLGLGVLNAVNPLLYLLGALILFCLIPVIIIRALRFNARVSSYRNVRFDFVGEIGEAFVTYFLIPLGNAFTLYLCSPFVARASHRFTTNNARYGDRPMRFEAEIGKYYTPFLIAIAIAIGGMILLSMIAGGTLMGMSGALGELKEAAESGSDPDPAQMGGLMGVLLAIYLGMFLVVVPASLFYRAWVRNVHLNNTVLDEQHHLESTVHPGRYIWIVVSNAFASLFTLGLMIPWGRIRLAKYMASVTAVNSEGSLDGYMSDVQETAGVLSSEYMDLEGFDIDIGI